MEMWNKQEINDVLQAGYPITSNTPTDRNN